MNDEQPNPYESPTSIEEVHRPGGPVNVPNKSLVYLLVFVAFVPTVGAWCLLCCGLGWYYHQDLLAPINNANAQQHFLRGLPTAIVMGVVSGFSVAYSVWRKLSRQAADYRRDQLLD